MKCHCFLQASLPGTLEIDKKIPFLKTFFPASTIEKKPFIGDREFVIVKDIVKDAKLTSMNNINCDLQLQIDFYATELFAYACIDLQFEITEEMASLINPGFMLLKSNIFFEGEEQSVSNLIPKILWAYYQTDKLVKIMSDEKFMKINKTDFESMSEEILDELGVKLFYSGDRLTGGMSASPGCILIEDYENKISMGNKWIDIGAYEKQVYHHGINKYTFVLKEQEHFREAYMVIIEMGMSQRFFNEIQNFCSKWIGRIGHRVDEVRKNILSNHENKYYWKELKKTVEIIDLNFLEFHASVTKECFDLDLFPNTLNLEFSTDYIEKYKGKCRQAKDSFFKAADEIKYALSNLATPGHTHDEHLLQEETEKVHEMLLMISFIAMAIPCGVAITTPNISMIFKIFAAAAIFSIPIIYFIFRKTQKSLAFKRNIKAELKRQYKSMTANVTKEKERQKTLESIEVLPEDLRQSIIDLNQQGIDAQEKHLRLLEKKL